MALKRSRTLLLTGLLALPSFAARAQVFVVGVKTATAEIKTDFTPTDLALPDGKMGERGRRDLVRNLEAEQGFAHRALPIWAGVVLRANGPLTPGPDEYRKMVYEKGQAAAAGDRVIVTAIQVKADRIVLDLNGGPYLSHRLLRHVELNDAPITAITDQKATGSRVTLVFEGQVPEISAPEVKALLEPLIDFGVKSSEQAYADTLPPTLKETIAAHEVLVGMNRRMVLAALGAPENKLRDQPSGDSSGERYEEWIYGHVPQTVRFIRFVGDRVTMIEVAALGKPIEIHDKNEMGDYDIPVPTREIALGDRTTGAADTSRPAPSLRLPGEAAPSVGPGKVQFPSDTKPAATTTPATPPPANFSTISLDDPASAPRLP